MARKAILKLKIGIFSQSPLRNVYQITPLKYPGTRNSDTRNYPYPGIEINRVIGRTRAEAALFSSSRQNSQILHPIAKEQSIVDRQCWLVFVVVKHGEDEFASGTKSSRPWTLTKPSWPSSASSSTTSERTSPPFYVSWRRTTLEALKIYHFPV